MQWSCRRTSEKLYTILTFGSARDHKIFARAQMKKIIPEKSNFAKETYFFAIIG